MCIDDIGAEAPEGAEESPIMARHLRAGWRDLTSRAFAEPGCIGVPTNQSRYPAVSGRHFLRVGRIFNASV